MCAERSRSATSFSLVGAYSSLLQPPQVLAQSVIPLFWSLHHAAQPVALHVSIATRMTLELACKAACLLVFVQAASIAIVNSVGNCGGFVGPFLLGAVHDATGARACVAWVARCVAQWGPGTVLVGAGVALITASQRHTLGAATRVPAQPSV